MHCTIAFCLLVQAADSPRPSAFPFPAEESRRYQKESFDLAKLPVKCEHPEAITLKLVPHFGHSNPGFRVVGRLGEPKEANKQLSADDVLKGLRAFYQKTARPDGSFQPGIDPAYRGMSDAAYSDLAAVTYAVVLHKTFGWKLPDEQKTAEFLWSRQKPSGEFFNVAGTVSPDSPEGRTYNTTQGLVALHALGLKPKHDPRPARDV
jgi:hypothetical protein